jgi:hypothetical protein
MLLRVHAYRAPQPCVVADHSLQSHSVCWVRCCLEYSSCYLALAVCSLGDEA